MRARESSQEVSLFSFQGAGTLDLKRERKRDKRRGRLPVRRGLCEERAGATHKVSLPTFFSKKVSTFSSVGRAPDS